MGSDDAEQDPRIDRVADPAVRPAGDEFGLDAPGHRHPPNSSPSPVRAQIAKLSPGDQQAQAGRDHHRTMDRSACPGKVQPDQHRAGGEQAGDCARALACRSARSAWSAAPRPASRARMRARSRGPIDAAQTPPAPIIGRRPRPRRRHSAGPARYGRAMSRQAASLPAQDSPVNVAWARDQQRARAGIRAPDRGLLRRAGRPARGGAGPSRREEALHVVALAGDRVVGTLRVLVDGARAKIGRVAVARDYRRRGIAHRMMLLGLDGARKRAAAKPP